VEHADVALARLIELAPEGFEQVDLDGFVEFALYGAPGELPDLPRGRADLAGIPIEVSGSEVGDDWADRWRQFHKPVRIGHIHVRAPWHDPAAGIEIVVDPGQAFGTGAHPTTRMCLELLLDVSGDAREGTGGEPAGGPPPDRGHAGRPPPDRGPAGRPPPDRGPLADLGCGSGVLAIAAAKLGFGPITAVDHELAAVRATMENARLNGVTLDRVERVDLREEAAPVAPVTVANLVRPLLLRVAELLREQPETLIVSGLLEGEEDEVAAAFASLRERRRLRLQEWSALLLTRP
jgi:ribosomal protein L11 methyltransferase